MTQKLKSIELKYRVSEGTLARFRIELKRDSSNELYYSVTYLSEQSTSTDKELLAMAKRVLSEVLSRPSVLTHYEEVEVVEKFYNGEENVT